MATINEIRTVTDDMQRKIAFLAISTNKLSNEDYQALKNVSHKLDVIYKTIYLREFK